MYIHISLSHTDNVSLSALKCKTVSIIFFSMKLLKQKRSTGFQERNVPSQGLLLEVIPYGTTIIWQRNMHIKAERKQHLLELILSEGFLPGFQPTAIFKPLAYCTVRRSQHHSQTRRALVSASGSEANSNTSGNQHRNKDS